MPQITPNTANIITFGFDVSVDIYNRSMLFNIATLTNFTTGGGQSNVLGVAFSLIDSDGIALMSVDWSNPQILPSSGLAYTLDLSDSPANFLFQGYSIVGYIKDQDGTVYNTPTLYKSIPQPDSLTEEGYVCGSFDITPDCFNNVLTVKEFTVFVYNNSVPQSVTKNGTLYYPTGTISPLTFSNTPLTNNVVYTGEYRINCTTVATYNLGDDIYVLVTYLTQQPFPVVCSNFLGDVTCCITEVYNNYLRNCENAIGQAALQKYNSVFPSVLNGLVKQMNGQDASFEVAQIKKTLNCNCGNTSLKQNELTPTSQNMYSIVLIGGGATNIPTSTVSGNTKSYTISSSSYIITKGNTGDAAFTLSIDASVPNVVKTVITFNYDVQAGYILNAISADPTLLNQLNSLVSGGGGSIAGLNGGCVIDLTKSDYAVSQAAVTSSTLISSITIGGVIHLAPNSLYANNSTAVASWLNSLTLGTFTAVNSGGTLTIQSVSNSNTVSTITFANPNLTKQFSSTNATLLQVLQAIINYLCAMNDSQVALSQNLSLCTFDYNGNVITTNFTTTQSAYNVGVSSAICNIVSRMNSLTAVTCATLKAIFVDNPSVSFSSSDRIYGTLGGNCASITDQQLANLVIAAVGKYSDVKTAWCAINCGTSGTCPDVSNSNLSMSGSSIGVYGLSWNNVPISSQTVTVKYRVSGTLVWNVATNALVILPNGNISGTSPFIISGVSVGTTYDVLIQNNCGGNGFIKQITTPTGSVYTGNYLLENSIYTICGGTLVTLYSNQPFASGITMYSNIGLTTVVTGYTFITKAGSDIFGLNTSTGVVGIDTGASCSNGIAGSYKLGTSISLCANTPTTLYTNSGTIFIGQTMFTDSALTNPVTTYTYIAGTDGEIYDINSSTGVITGDEGIVCAPLTVSLSRSSGTLAATITGGVPPYSFIFNSGYSGPCEGHTFSNPSGTTAHSGDVVSTGFTTTAYSGTTYQLTCTATDSSSFSSNSNIITIAPCLVPETMITLKDGTEKMLGDLEEGVELFGESNKIESFEKKVANELYVINGGLLKASAGHIHIVANEVDTELVRSSDLCEGEFLMDKNGDIVEVESIEIVEGEFDVIDISTTNETFIANGILTHNKLACP